MSIIRRRTMSPDNSTFCDQVNNAGRVIEDAGMNDFRDLVDRQSRSGRGSP